MLGECRGVEDDEIVGVALHAVKVVESILGERLVALVARIIKFHIALGKHHGLARAVNGVHQFSAATHRIERETTSVAKHV